MAKAPFVRIDRSRRVIVMVRGKWSGEFPVEQLPRQAAFYRHLATRAGGKYAAIYRPMVAEIERVTKALQERPIQ